MSVRKRAGGALDRLQRSVARSDRATQLAVLARNQCNRVVRYHLAGGHRQDETGEVWLVRTTAPRLRTFVDVGANVGDWTALVRQHAPHAAGLLFEPSTAALRKLRHRFGNQRGIDIVDAAVAAEPGEADFFEEPDAGESSSMVPGHAPAGSSARRVRVTTLDDELDRRGVERVDLMKVDAEGYDFEVLRGALRYLREHRVAVIQFEYNRPWARAGATLAGAIGMLAEHGYETLLLRDDGLEKIDHEFYGEFFDYANFVALSPGAQPLVPTR
jgi:FkbM family methyltransferase